MLDAGVLPGHLFEGSEPEVAAKAHHIVLVGHADRFAAAAVCEIECIANDPFDALPRGDVFLHGNLVGSSLLEVAPHADIGAFSVLAKNHEVDLLLFFEWRESLVEKLYRTVIDVEVELKAHAEEDVRG